MTRAAAASDIDGRCSEKSCQCLAVVWRFSKIRRLDPRAYGRPRVSLPRDQLLRTANPHSPGAPELSLLTRRGVFCAAPTSTRNRLATTRRLPRPATPRSAALTRLYDLAKLAETTLDPASLARAGSRISRPAGKSFRPHSPSPRDVASVPRHFPATVRKRIGHRSPTRHGGALDFAGAM